jgi:Flp pilus assembly pilin Flp
MLKKHLTQTHGQDLAEYALLLGLIAVVVMVAIAAFGVSLEALFAGLANTWIEIVAMISPDPEPDPEPEPEPVPDCYGSLLLPIMVAVAGLGATVSRWWPTQPAVAHASGLAESLQNGEGPTGSSQSLATGVET